MLVIPECKCSAAQNVNTIQAKSVGIIKARNVDVVRPQTCKSH